MGRYVVRFALAALVCALVGAVPVSTKASAAPAFPVLLGQVGPNTHISLLDPQGVELDGRTLPAGVYTVEVDDSEVGHNFHLFGPGVLCTSDCRTTITETGHQTWTVAFKPGQVTYQCDPHSGFMIGTFMVTDPPPPPPPPPQPPPPPPPTPPPPISPLSCPTGSTPVAIGDNFFNPASVNVPPGSTVCWTNGGAIHHTVTSDTGLFDSADLAPGATFSFTFATVGDFGYHCAYHQPAMAGSVTVSTAPPPPPPPPPPPAPPPPPPPPPPPAGALVATVGTDGGRAIAVTQNGQQVSQIPAGTYTIQVRDRSRFHNFHLKGPGVDRATTIAFVGTVTWTVTLTSGVYTFVCDAHVSLMHGSFGVDRAPPTPKKARCKVPRVVGKKLVTARRLIIRAKCRVGRVRRARSSRARGRVLSQSPRAGAKRARGARVNLLVSRGPPARS